MSPNQKKASYLECFFRFEGLSDSDELEAGGERDRERLHLLASNNHVVNYTAEGIRGSRHRDGKDSPSVSAT